MKILTYYVVIDRQILTNICLLVFLVNNHEFDSLKRLISKKISKTICAEK